MNTISMEALLGANPEWHVWVLEYGISHGRRMTLALHHGDYPRRYDVVASACSYFRGNLEGGPYELAVEPGVDESVPGPAPPMSVRLFDRRGELEIVCESLAVVREW